MLCPNCVRTAADDTGVERKGRVRMCSKTLAPAGWRRRASLFSADCQSRGRGFKSRRARHKAERMQGVGVSLRQPLARVCARIVYDGASVAFGIVALNVALRA